VYRGTVMFTGVANAPTYGGGMRLSPPAIRDIPRKATSTGIAHRCRGERPR
jgi:hypothetical protein